MSMAERLRSIDGVFGFRTEFVEVRLEIFKLWKTQNSLVQILPIKEYETRPIMSKNYKNKNNFKQIKCDLLYFLYGQ